MVLVRGELVLYVERGGKTLLTWTDEPSLLQPAVDALALAVRDGTLGPMKVERADGDSVLVARGTGQPVDVSDDRGRLPAHPGGLRLRG